MFILFITYFMNNINREYTYKTRKHITKKIDRRHDCRHDRITLPVTFSDLGGPTWCTLLPTQRSILLAIIIVFSNLR